MVVVVQCQLPIKSIDASCTGFTRLKACMMSAAALSVIILVVKLDLIKSANFAHLIQLVTGHLIQLDTGHLIQLVTGHVSVFNCLKLKL